MGLVRLSAGVVLPPSCWRDHLAHALQASWLCVQSLAVFLSWQVRYRYLLCL